MPKRSKKMEKWQKNPESLDNGLSAIQLWSKSGIMMGMMAKEDAIEKVENGNCFVITSQAIGEIKR